MFYKFLGWYPLTNCPGIPNTHPKFKQINFGASEQCCHLWRRGGYCNPIHEKAISGRVSKRQKKSGILILTQIFLELLFLKLSSSLDTKFFH